MILCYRTPNSAMVNLEDWQVLCGQHITAPHVTPWCIAKPKFGRVDLGFLLNITSKKKKTTVLEETKKKAIICCSTSSDGVKKFWALL